MVLTTITSSVGNGLEKYMKFTMFKKETTDKKYHEDPFRAVNFPIGKAESCVVQMGKAFIFSIENVKGNKYGPGRSVSV